MKAVDIIKKLKEIIPKYSGLFSSNFTVNSLTFSGGYVTCTCSIPHELSVGDEVFVSGALTPITINSLNRLNNLVTAVTNSNHDLTRDYQLNVDIIGASPAAYNGSHPLVDVPNRRTFIYSLTTTPSTPASGHPKILENIKAGYNGIQTVHSVIDQFSFTYAITSTPESPAEGSITLRTGLCITGDITIQRFLEAYTKQATDHLFAVVILGATNSSKDRFTVSDATNTGTSPTVDARIRIIDPFSIYIVVPTTSTITAMTARDAMEDLWRILNKSILFQNFPTDSESQSNMSVTFVSHGVFSYEKAYYLHEFNYEFVYDLVREDGADNDDSVAFRDIDLHFLNPNNVDIMHTLVDLDDQPLP